MQQLSTGATLQGGKYIIERILGQGGFGITYLAENTILDKKVAIKEFFPKDYCNREATTSHISVGTQTNVSLVEKLKNRFLKEARNISRLNNPGVVKIHDVFVENNSAYYVMDYIEGESLSDIVKKSGPMDERRAVRYITEVGNALEYIHSMNMTHFDVKPANIMIRKSDDRPVLIDFGLSKQYTEAGEATTTGITGASRGFSPIEMYNLDSLAEFSPQSDVYSLGATLLYLITGKTPPDATVLTQQEVEIPSYVNRNISNAIRCSMQINRRNRCQSIINFISKLKDNEESTRVIPAIEENKVISEPKVGENDDNEPRKSISSKLIAGLIIVGVIFIGIFMINKQKDTPPDNEPFYSDLSDTFAVEVLPTEEETTLAVEESNNYRYFSINELKYNATIAVNLNNGELRADVNINGDQGVDIYKYNKSFDTTKVLDLYQGLVYYDAACALASYIVLDDNTYNEEFMNPTLKLLKMSSEFFCRSKGNDPIAYEGVMSRYKMLKELNPANYEDREDISIITWGMSEHPVEPNGLKYISSH